ncbi:zf-RING_2 domain-containing protein [Cephalotus follicularis]|uniref:RING-type E3 ubiquitin transferase n=1 Tax=Cephalotus follicularis TaxID=3775 RepID=A0A1Q3BLH7_CEPFO|nr:zf-RING_2 domain-containing protein [Cephalotus follicularis]
MGHRHFFSTSRMFDNEYDQNWNHMHTEQPYANLARAGAAENGSFFYPVDNMNVDGVQFTSHWNHPPMSNGYTCLNHNVGVPHYQPDASGPSHDPFLHPSTAGAFCPVPENFAHHASSSNYDGQAFQGIEGGFIDLTMGNGRGHHKRKSPGIPSVCDRDSISRYYVAGTSSDLPLQEKPNTDTERLPWDPNATTPGYRGNGLAIRGEGSMRNVRSRPAIDLESNLARNHLLSNSSQNPYTAGRVVDPQPSVDLSGQSSSVLMREWNHIRMSPLHGRGLLPDINGFGHETNHVLPGISGTNALAELGGFHHDFGFNRTPVFPQGFHGTSSQSVRGVRSSYSQRSSTTFRASSSSLRLGHVPPSDDGLQMGTETYSSRHPRSLSTSAWRNSDRNGRSRICNESGLHGRFSSAGFMIEDRSAFLGSRDFFDHHGDMRLDVDNMTYEELLALEERIGNVSTGVSEDLISQCLTETIYCSSHQIQEEGTCVICLEEYKDMDDVGALKTCSHDYHVSCIRKWLSMKNLCPICKASVVPDNTKENK